MKKLSFLHLTILLVTLLFCTLRGQTYTVGDTVDTFGADVCVNGEGYVQIYDMLGKEVYENYLSGHHIWDTRNLPSGIYHVINKGETVTVTLLK